LHSPSDSAKNNNFTGFTGTNLNFASNQKQKKVAAPLNSTKIEFGEDELMQTAKTTHD